MDTINRFLSRHEPAGRILRFTLGLALLTSLQTTTRADLDAALLDVCLELANEPSKATLRSRLMEHPNIAKMEKGLGDRFRISFDQIEQNRDRIESLQQLLPDLRRRLPLLVEDASAFLGPDAIPATQRINVVCGGPFDGYALTLGDTTELFLDATLIDPDFIESLIRHELWHVGFKAKYASMFERDYHAADPLRRLAYELLNEGVGHYYSFQRRVEPEIGYDDWTQRTRRIFALLESESARLASVDTRGLQDEMIWSAHVGVPFWRKWGAVPGAIIAYRLRKSLGTADVAAIVSTGPCGFLTRYNEIARETPTWEAVPLRVIDAACAD